MEIKAKEATVKTAHVEVKALMIGGKQFTLSVFRQLKEENLINEDSVELNGVPWGTVNYHPSKDCLSLGYDHVHVIWQKGDDLRADTVVDRFNSNNSSRVKVRELCTQFAKLIGVFTEQKILQGEFVPENLHIWGDEYMFEQTYKGIKLNIPIRQDIGYVVFSSYYTIDKKMEQLAKLKPSATAVSKDEIDLFFDGIEQKERQCGELERKRKDVFQQLKTMDQLFISV